MMKTAKLIPINDYQTLKLEIDVLHSRIAELQLQLMQTELHASNHPGLLEKGVLVATTRGSRYVKISDIQYIKAESNYSSLVLSTGESLLTSKTLKYWSEKYNSNLLLRVHQSYLVNYKKIEKIDHGANEIKLDKKSIPISRSGKKVLKQLFGK